MARSEAYDAFAWAYDPALGRRFFEAAAPLLEEILTSHGIATGRHLDVACGSGLVVEWMRRRGFHSTGLDASLPMLAVAKERSSRLVAGDMRALPLRGTFALVTSLYDSLNHLLSRREMLATFEGVESALDRDGLFVFDVNHPSVYPRVWGAEEPYESESGDHTLSIATRWSPLRQRGEADVTGWVRIGGRVVTIDEKRRQRAWSERAIRSLLAEAGMGVVEVIPFDPFAEAEEDPIKLVFVARRG